MQLLPARVNYVCQVALIGRSLLCLVRMRIITGVLRSVRMKFGLFFNLKIYPYNIITSNEALAIDIDIPDREASLIKKENCRCGPHPLQVISSRAGSPLVKGAGCIGPLFPDFRGWPLWFMASIALQGLQTPCTRGCSWRLIAL